MMMDTDVLIWASRGNARAVDVLSKQQGFYLSVVAYMEMVQGVRSKQELAALQKALRLWSARVLHITDAISQRAMFLMERHSLSHALTLADALIAATALQHQEPLLTSNAKHYGAIPGLTLLRFTP
ncbi:MAG: type II toxin-antitoxin system VapC family toxin [Planctomycetota bacterium]